MQEEHEKAVKPVSFRLSSLLLLAGKEKFILQWGGWDLGCILQARETLLALPQWLQSKAMKLWLSLWSEAWVQASASLLIPSILSKETKMSLKHVDMIGTCLHWVFPREFSASRDPSALHHFGKNYGAPSCLVTVLRKASEYVTLWDDVPAPRISFGYFRYDNDPFKELIKIGWVSYLPQFQKRKIIGQI